MGIFRVAQKKGCVPMNGLFGTRHRGQQNNGILWHFFQQGY